MLYSAALFVALLALWLALHAAAPGAVAAGAIAAVASILVGLWFGAAKGVAWPALRANLPGRRRIGEAARILRAAVAADVTLEPALVRVRAPADASRLPLGAAINATPGAVVVAEDDDGFLVHVLDEARAEPDAIARLASTGMGKRSA